MVQSIVDGRSSTARIEAGFSVEVLASPATNTRHRERSAPVLAGRRPPPYSIFVTSIRWIMSRKDLMKAGSD